MTMNKKRSLEEEATSSIKVIPWSDLHKRRRISKGGQANIYEAELKSENRTVAIRELITQLSR